MKQYSGFEAKKIGGAREILPAGGYVAEVISAKVESTDWGDKLVIAFDIAEGERKGFFKADFDGNTMEDKRWRGTYRTYIPVDDGSERDGWSKRTMNNVIACFQESNPGFAWNWDEKKLKGLKVGVLFRNKEWKMNDRTGWTTECFALETVDAIREGKFRTPKDKPLKTSAVEASGPALKPIDEIDPSELPF